MTRGRFGQNRRGLLFATGVSRIFRNPRFGRHGTFSPIDRLRVQDIIQLQANDSNRNSHQIIHSNTKITSHLNDRIEIRVRLPNYNAYRLHGAIKDSQAGPESGLILFATGANGYGVD